MDGTLLGRQVGAVCVNVVHGGTLVGLLFEHSAVDQTDVTSFLRRRVGEANVVGWRRIIGGGPTALHRENRSEYA